MAFPSIGLSFPSALSSARSVLTAAVLSAGTAGTLLLTVDQPSVEECSARDSFESVHSLFIPGGIRHPLFSPRQAQIVSVKASDRAELKADDDGFSKGVLIMGIAVVVTILIVLAMFDHSEQKLREELRKYYRGERD